MTYNAQEHQPNITSEHQSSYRQIMKATSLFGGVQVFNIIIRIIRSKFVAVLLGPQGMGIMGLLLSTTGLISSVTNFGLGTSAVKDIAAAFGANDEKRIGTVITVMHRMVWITGLLGLILTIILSPWLSELTFGNKDYKFSFIWLSLTLLFDQLTSGQLVLLQGLRKLNYLAKANLFGSFLGLFITIPMYYLWGIEGIVPGIISMSFLSLVVSYFFSSKIKFFKTKLTPRQTFLEGKSMLQMGFLISLSGLMVMGSSYIVRIFISRTGSIDQVGLYNAGFVIINTYVGLIFTAMGTDYYPRLSAVSTDNNLCKRTINQQAEIAILILAPILIIFLVFIKWIIVFLYSNKFIGISDMVYWAALGMLFKAASWSVAFIFLAKGTRRLYFWNEVISNTYFLIFNLIGYHLWGITGLGFSFSLSYFLYLIQVYVISRIKFDFNFGRNFLYIFFIQLGFSLMVFLCVKFINHPYNYFIGIIVLTLSGIHALGELNKRLEVKNLIKKYLSR